jgi:hypothetical protein
MLHHLYPLEPKADREALREVQKAIDHHRPPWYLILVRVVGRFLAIVLTPSTGRTKVP